MLRVRCRNRGIWHLIEAKLTAQIERERIGSGCVCAIVEGVMARGRTGSGKPIQMRSLGMAGHKRTDDNQSNAQGRSEAAQPGQGDQHLYVIPDSRGDCRGKPKPKQ